MSPYPLHPFGTPTRNEYEVGQVADIPEAQQTTTEANLEEILGRIAGRHGLQLSAYNRSLVKGSWWKGSDSESDQSISARYDASRNRLSFGVKVYARRLSASWARSQAESIKTEIERSLKERFPLASFSNFVPPHVAQFEIDVAPLTKNEEFEKIWAVATDTLKHAGLEVKRGPAFITGLSRGIVDLSAGTTTPGLHVSVVLCHAKDGVSIRIAAYSPDYVSLQSEIADRLLHILGQSFGADRIGSGFFPRSAKDKKGSC